MCSLFVTCTKRKQYLKMFIMVKNALHHNRTLALDECVSNHNSTELVLSHSCLRKHEHEKRFQINLWDRKLLNWLPPVSLQFPSTIIASYIYLPHEDSVVDWQRYMLACKIDWDCFLGHFHQLIRKITIMPLNQTQQPGMCMKKQHILRENNHFYSFISKINSIPNSVSYKNVSSLSLTPSSNTVAASESISIVYIT